MIFCHDAGATTVSRCVCESRSQKHATQRNFACDAGNLLGDGTHTYQWDAEGRLKSVDNGATANVERNVRDSILRLFHLCSEKNSKGRNIRGRMLRYFHSEESPHHGKELPRPFAHRTGSG